MKMELLPYVLNFVQRAYNFGDRRYSELKRTYPAVLDNCYWTPATLFGVIEVGTSEKVIVGG